MQNFLNWSVSFSLSCHKGMIAPMKFGIVCPPVPGHLYGMMTIGRELERRGHSVYLLGIGDVEPYARKGGVGFVEIGKEEFPPGALDQYLDLIRNVTISTIRKGVAWAEVMCQALCRDGATAARELGLDGLLVDQSQTEGKTISDLTGIPFLSICNALNLEGDASGEAPPPFVSWYPAQGKALFRIRNRLGNWAFSAVLNPIIATTNKLRKAHNLPLLQNWENCISPLGVISNFPSKLDFSRGLNQRPIFYTGPYLDERPNDVAFDWSLLDGRPLVYASMGTLHTAKKEILSAIVAACSTLPVQLVLSLGQWTLEQADQSFPAGTIAVPYAPQLALLRRASLAITHGGANTVLEALSFGCPLITIPLASDQPAVSARVTWAGAGTTIAQKQVDAVRLRQLIAQVLENPDFKNCAEVMKTEIENSGGVKAAVNVIESVFSSATISAAR
ncbi:MAG: hypothetical protein BJG00_012545 [Limnothrix sp. CACIAM 69d]|nr:MAG: hypothetical protein BJG00_012545 [Limnothrix sp. CACIAM 69d]